MTVTGVATLAFSFSDFISKGLGFLLNFELKMMNIVVFYVEKLPGALITNISISYTQVILLYILFLSFLVFKKKKKRHIICFFVFLNIFLSIYIRDIIIRKNHIEVVNYHIAKCSAFQFCRHGSAVFVSDSICHTFDKQYQFNIQNHDRIMRIENTFVKLDGDFENSFFCKKGNFIFFRDTIYVLETNKLKKNMVDLVVYHNNFSDGGVHKLE
jgi:competence protein ComEC